MATPLARIGEFNLAFIPASFDTAYMRKLFDLAYGMAAAGYSWYKEPPVLLSGEELPPEPR